VQDRLNLRYVDFFVRIYGYYQILLILLVEFFLGQNFTINSIIIIFVLPTE